jgi:2-oxoglutarate ferredoxin oxidoreductase subunit beta
MVTEDTWCPGCFNHSILNAMKNITKGKEKEFAIVTGIGCHAKMYDYLNINAVYSLHGRTLPVAMGIKLAQPNLKVVCFSGDGDSYAEGISHWMHTMQYNTDITLVVHDNRVFALTTGQPTPTTEIGYKSKVSPQGTQIKPMNPIKIALAAGCRFVARASTLDPKQLEEILQAAIKHKGFSFVEVMQPCIIFHGQDTGMLREKTYKITGKLSREEAIKKAEEFDYNSIEKIPTGIFYSED